MRMLLPEPRDLAESDLTDLYDWPADLARPWVRGLMAMALDGTFVGPDGVSGSVSGSADKLVFSASRSLADVYLVGAGTVRAEGYRPIRAREDLAERRVGRGQRRAPVLAVVTANCRFDWSRAAWPDSDERPLLLTTASSDPGFRAVAQAQGCEVVIVGDRRVVPADAIAALAERGLLRVNCEGGPSLLGEIIGADLLDELALTLSPLVTHAQVPHIAGRVVSSRMRLEQLAEQDGFLFSRYLRDRSEAPDLRSPA